MGGNGRGRLVATRRRGRRFGTCSPACRHNRYVQQYGRVRDGDEVARREDVWAAAIDRIELRTGHEAGAIAPTEFRRLLAQEIDVATFQRREAV